MMKKLVREVVRETVMMGIRGKNVTLTCPDVECIYWWWLWIVNHTDSFSCERVQQQPQHQIDTGERKSKAVSQILWLCSSLHNEQQRTEQQHYLRPCKIHKNNFLGSPLKFCTRNPIHLDRLLSDRVFCMAVGDEEDIYDYYEAKVKSHLPIHPLDPQSALNFLGIASLIHYNWLTYNTTNPGSSYSLTSQEEMRVRHTSLFLKDKRSESLWTKLAKWLPIHYWSEWLTWKILSQLPM